MTNGSVFQYPVIKAKAPSMGDVGAIQTLGSVVETVGTIYGQTPGSVEEWRVAVALWKYKIPFQYQYPINGGRAVRGGQVVDFVVTRPYYQAVQVFGEHWHSGSLGLEDVLKLAAAEKYFGRKVVVFWGAQLTSQDATNRLVRSELV